MVELFASFSNRSYLDCVFARDLWHQTFIECKFYATRVDISFAFQLLSYANIVAKIYAQSMHISFNRENIHLERSDIKNVTTTATTIVMTLQKKESRMQKTTKYICTPKTRSHMEKNN